MSEQIDAAVVRARIEAILERRKASLAAGPRTMVELAEQLGTDKGNLAKYLTGERRLKIDGRGKVTVEAIAAALSVGAQDALPVATSDLLDGPK